MANAAQPLSGPLHGKRILLIIGGGIAAYKSLELIREIRRAGGAVTPVLTAAGAEFVTPLAVAALAENIVHQQLFDLTAEAEMGHIQLSRSADLLLVCPGTANLMARMAHGLADDLSTTLLLATDTPVMVAPAMNVRMWAHPATRANVETLRARGVQVLEPDVGPMACGEYGAGRLPEVATILQAVQQHFAPDAGRLAGRHVLVTAGPTHEPIDPVRYIANRSSGKQGYAIAAALRALGARVTLVSGPVSIAPPPAVDLVQVETAVEMQQAVMAALPADAAVMVAAVADWRTDGAQFKIKKGADGPPAINLRENPDILRELSHHAQRPELMIGFAAETNDVIANAQAKLQRKGCDLIIANDVSGDVMGGDRNRVHMVSPDGVTSLPEGAKSDIAMQIAEHLAGMLGC